MKKILIAFCACAVFSCTKAYADEGNAYKYLSTIGKGIEIAVPQIGLAKKAYSAAVKTLDERACAAVESPMDRDYGIGILNTKLKTKNSPELTAGEKIYLLQVTSIYNNGLVDYIHSAAYDNANSGYYKRNKAPQFGVWLQARPDGSLDIYSTPDLTGYIHKPESCDETMCSQFYPVPIEEKDKTYLYKFSAAEMQDAKKLLEKCSGETVK